MRVSITTQLVKSLTDNAKARFDRDNLQDAVSCVLTMIDSINKSNEFTDRLNTVEFSKLAIPEQFGWLIQPRAVRLVDSQSFENLRADIEFTDQQSDLDEVRWNESWHLILSVLKKDFIPAQTGKDVYSLRAAQTLTEQVCYRLTDGERAAPGFSYKVDPIFVRALPFRQRALVSFEISDIMDKVADSVRCLASHKT